MYKAAARYDYQTGRIFVYVRSEGADGIHVNWVPVEGQNHTRVGMVSNPGEERLPSYIFDEAMSRPIYEALKQLYEPNTDNVVALRKDYDHERARVDKLLDHLLAPPTVIHETRVGNFE